MATGGMSSWRRPVDAMTLLVPAGLHLPAPAPRNRRLPGILPHAIRHGHGALTCRLYKHRLPAAGMGFWLFRQVACCSARGASLAAIARSQTTISGLAVSKPRPARRKLVFGASVAPRLAQPPSTISQVDTANVMLGPAAAAPLPAASCRSGTAVAASEADADMTKPGCLHLVEGRKYSPPRITTGQALHGVGRASITPSRRNG